MKSTGQKESHFRLHKLTDLVRSGPLKVIYPVEQSQEIKFYDREDPYYEFTNFYPCHVVIDGKTWPSTEHYFQAQKFVGTPYVEAIRLFPTAREAFQLSRSPQASRWCRGDWERVKEDIMLKALRCKFNDNPELKKKLLATGNKRLIEHTHNDSYWADGGDGSGKNKLGKLLERVRSELQSPPRDALDLDLKTLTISKSKAEMVPMDYTSHQSPLRRSSSFSGSTRHIPSVATAQRTGEWNHYSQTNGFTSIATGGPCGRGNTKGTDYDIISGKPITRSTPTSIRKKFK
ncbi:hypothetical protein EMCRGX_G002406 [Ephydatia muelleri]